MNAWPPMRNSVWHEARVADVSVCSPAAERDESTAVKELSFSHGTHFLFTNENRTVRTSALPDPGARDS